MAQSLNYPTTYSSHRALGGGLTPPAAQKDPHAEKSLKAFACYQTAPVAGLRSGQHIVSVLVEKQY